MLGGVPALGGLRAVMNKRPEANCFGQPTRLSNGSLLLLTGPERILGEHVRRTCNTLQEKIAVGVDSRYAVLLVSEWLG